MESIDILSYQQEDFYQRIYAGYPFFSQGNNLFTEIVNLPEITINKITNFCHSLTTKYQSFYPDINLFNYYFNREIINYSILNLYGDLLSPSRDDKNFALGNYHLFFLKENSQVKILVNLVNFYFKTTNLQETKPHNNFSFSHSLTSDNLQSIQWNFSAQSLKDCQIVICLFSPNKFNNSGDTIPNKISVVFGGFFLTNLLKLSQDYFTFTLKDLFYCGGLRGYFYSFIHSESYHLTLAKDATNNGNYLGAIANYNKALNLNFNNSKTHLLRAISRWKIGDKQGALADCDEAIRIEPDFHLAYHWRGYIHFKLGNYPLALDNYSQEIKLNSYSTYAYYRRGFTHEKLHNLVNAFDDYSQVILLNKNLYQAYYNRGNIRYELGDVEGAIDDFNQALKLNPCLSQCYYNRGIIYNNLGKINLAIMDYESAIQLNPNYEKAYYNLAVLLGDLGQEKQAINYYEKVIKINPEFYQAKYNKEYLLNQLHKEKDINPIQIENNKPVKQVNKLIINKKNEEKSKQKPLEKSEDLLPENIPNLIIKDINKKISQIQEEDKMRESIENKLNDPWDTKKYF